MSVRKKTSSLKYLIPFQEIQTPIDWRKYFDVDGPLSVEIGFGTGEFLVDSARKNPQINYVGIEKDWERIRKTLKKIDILAEEINQSGVSVVPIKILKLDATVVLSRLFDQKGIDTIYCLFPCPWPKKGHAKFRLFSKDFLRLANSRLKSRGEMTIVTDCFPYFEWICESVQDTGFDVKTTTILPTYDTKFERKWREAGQEEFYKIELKKKKHFSVSVPKDIVMKSYTIPQFNPSQFYFSNQTGDCSIIFRDMLFDQEKRQAVVQLVVAEKDMTQNIRIMITHKEDGWNICKAGGQIFFPTTGIAKAIELVYEAANNSYSKKQ